MALTPEGTPYVESSDLVANYPAASLSLANRVDLVGVLPFASAAARTTAIPSPTDGQYSYLQDTNSTEFYNGVAWVAAGTAPGLVHINTTTFSAVSNVSINNVFTSTYDNYQILLDYTASAANEVFFRLRASGADITASNYNWQRFWATDATLSGGRSTANSVFPLPYSANRNAASINLFGPNLAQITNYLHTSNENSTTPFIKNLSGAYNATTVADGFSVYPLGLTITGTIRVYGYKNS